MGAWSGRRSGGEPFRHAPRHAAAIAGLLAVVLAVRRVDAGAVPVAAALLLVVLGAAAVPILAARRDARATEERFRTLVQQASDVIMVIADARVTYASPSVSRTLGYDEHEVQGLKYVDLIHPDDRQAVIDQVVAMADEPGTAGLIECRLRHADGHWVPFESNCRNLLHDPEVAGFVITGRDVTERKALEAELEHRAFHDPLTGLANRALLRDRIEHAIDRAERHDRPFALLYVDLDGFKAVNDTLGHAAGDAVLSHVGRRLAGAVRPADTAARLGGDEFAVLVEELDGPDGAADVAERVLVALRAPIVAEGRTIHVDASIGVATHVPGEGGEDLLRAADDAMYAAKAAGHGGVLVHATRGHPRADRRPHITIVTGPDEALPRVVERAPAAVPTTGRGATRERED